MKIPENSEFEKFYNIFTDFMKDNLKSSVKFSDLVLRKINFSSEKSNYILPEDRSFKENNNFSIPFLEVKKAKGIIIISHGLNEGEYVKLLPWMYTLTKLSHFSTTIFPLSFHLNRRPKIWLRNSVRFFRKRSNLLSNRTFSSMNAILSERLYEKPERFIYGARQSYYDFISFLSFLKKKFDIPIGFIGYSVSGFLILSLIMDEEMDKALREPKTVIFCSGSNMLSSNPESPLILDKLSTEKLKEFLYKFEPKKKEKVDMLMEKLFLEKDSNILKDGVKRVKEKLLIIAGNEDKVIPKESMEENIGMKADLTLPLGIHEIPFTASPKDLKDEGILHKKLKNSYAINNKFKDSFDNFMKACLDFFIP